MHVIHLSVSSIFPFERSHNGKIDSPANVSDKGDEMKPIENCKTCMQLDTATIVMTSWKVRSVCVCAQWNIYIYVGTRTIFDTNIEHIQVYAQHALN